jgi:GH18 family chitinase
MFLTLYIFITAQLAWAVPNLNPVASLRGNLRRNTDTTPNWARNKPRVSSEPRQAAAWYTPWHSSDFTLQNVSWGDYTSLYYAFA